MTKYKTVPVETTFAMRKAFNDANEKFEEGFGESPDIQWKAMLAAAPSPWVSVEERLPESPSCFGGDLYLAWWDGDEGGCETSWYCGNAGWQHADGEMDYHREGEVTHWMPLPEAPEVAA